MTTILLVILGVAVGFAIAFFLLRGEKEKLRSELFQEKEQLRMQLTQEKEQLREEMAIDKENLRAKLSSENDNLQKELSYSKEKESVAQANCKSANDALQREKEQSALMIEQIKNQYVEALQAMKSQFHQIASEELSKRAEELHKTNAEQILNIVNPVKEEITRVEKAVQDAKLSSVEQKAQVEKAIEGLATRTLEIGQKAENLANALKDNGKVQGDWGELLLESILEESGLRKGYEFFMQENIKDEEGKNLRPDVIVKCPGNKNVVIDSKVSITAYYNYTHAETEEEMRRFEKENLASVKKHVDELAAKKYDKIVGNTITHVLMFIPNEGSYILALRTDPQLGYSAYKKGVIIINPTNLMLALQLIYNLWQSERQTRNIENIIKQSSDLYDKFVTFVETFVKIEDSIKGAQKNFEAARNQLSNGKGNIVKRLENLKKLGVLPKKVIPESYIDKAESYDEDDTKLIGEVD